MIPARTSIQVLALAATALAASACAEGSAPAHRVPAHTATPQTAAAAASESGTAPAPALVSGQAEAVFAGGCFWCMESPFSDLPGVISVTSGYTGGDAPHPSYEEVSSGRTGHMEAVRVLYDPARVTYMHLLDVFWRNIDPIQTDGQFCDRGPQYRTAVFVRTEDERRLATESSERVAHQLGASVVTEIRDAGTFWIAEEYHQDFHIKNPERYGSYRASCGRDARLDELWGETP